MTLSLSTSPSRRLPRRRNALAAGAALLAGLAGVQGSSAAAPVPAAGTPTAATTATTATTGLAAVTAAADAYPLVASADRRGLRTSDGTAFHYVADTSWLALAKLDQGGFRALLDARRAQGFNTVQVSVLDFLHRSDSRNAYGDEPFVGGTDLSRPEVAGGRTTDPSSPAYDYWDHVDWAIDQAAARGMQLNLVPSWYGYQGEDWRGHVTTGNAASYGTFLGKRLGSKKNIMWLLGGDNNPSGDDDRVPSGRDRGDKTAATNRMGAAIRAAEPVRHLMSYHAKRGVPSWRDFDDAAWHTYSSAYSRELTYETVGASYGRTSPARPVVMTEAWYDARRRDPVLDRQRLRAQGYWTFLSGGVGFAYGHEKVWDLDSDWRTAARAGSAADVQRLTRLLDDPGTTGLRPDRGDRRMLATGYGESGTRSRAASARNAARTLGVAYLPSRRTVRVESAAFAAGSYRLTWVDPATGSRTSAGTWSTSTGDRGASYPQGWSDAVLVVRRS